MNAFIKEMITKKIKQISTEELLQYSSQYGFNLSKKEANHITAYLKSHTIDPFSARDRANMLQELAKITDLQTAKKAKKLFEEVIRSYGLESLFY